MRARRVGFDRTYRPEHPAFASGYERYGNMKKNTYGQAFFLLGTGAVFFVTGVLTPGFGLFPGILGGMFLSYGCYILWRGLRLPKQG